MPDTRFAALAVAVVFITGQASAQERSPMSDPTVTTYGDLSPRAPQELRVFSFLVGKWDGTGKTRLDNGTVAEYPVTWIGRYILDGTAIADEAHAPAPDGRPVLGITFRQYDATSRTWIIEFLNVSGSFLRKQVNRGSGSVAVNGRSVTITSASPNIDIREHYLVADDGNTFVYRLDLSRDGGKSWNEGQVEMNFRRSN
jgi:hypothetical protein